MLLETDSCSPQGAYVSRPTSDKGDPFGGPAPHDERTGTDRPVPGPRLLPEGCTKWLVGLPFHDSASRLVWLYYVIEGASSRTGAVWTALVRANSRREWEARGRVPVEAGQVEVHRIRCDAIGRYSLVRCS
ncbi:hypothetical protein ACWEQ7_05450 [Streptomyces sp. NPDC004069]|uniref:hypothetical protein n=1 Tax=Streptomyces sp. NPDC052043 TaxID=3365684 RepID=UPI0037D79822